MRQDEGRERADPQAPELLGCAALRRALIHKHRGARRLEEDRVALADVEESDPQPRRRLADGLDPGRPGGAGDENRTADGKRDRERMDSGNPIPQPTQGDQRAAEYDAGDEQPARLHCRARKSGDRACHQIEPRRSPTGERREPCRCRG